MSDVYSEQYSQFGLDEHQIQYQVFCMMFRLMRIAFGFRLFARHLICKLGFSRLFDQGGLVCFSQPYHQHFADEYQVKDVSDYNKQDYHMNEAPLTHLGLIRALASMQRGLFALIYSCSENCHIPISKIRLAITNIVHHQKLWQLFSKMRQFVQQEYTCGACRITFRYDAPRLLVAMRGTFLFDTTNYSLKPSIFIGGV